MTGDGMEDATRRLFALSESKERQLSAQVDNSESRIRAENSRRLGRDRSGISKAIIVTYALSVIGMGLYIALTVPDCPTTTTTCDPMAVWREQGKLLFDLIVTAVLPIVTLMLGFYFGTETTQSND